MAGKYTDCAHALQAPHREFAEPNQTLPEDFVPLRLELRSMDLYPKQQTFELTQPVVVVGRHSRADLRLAFDDVSRNHCRFEFIDGRWHIIDLDSLNGLHVNGERTGETALQEGDFVRVGSVTLVVLNKARSHPELWNGVLQSIADNLQ